MKEYCLNMLVIYKTEQQQKKIYNFINKFKGEVLVSIPIKANKLK